VDDLEAVALVTVSVLDAAAAVKLLARATAAVESALMDEF